MVDPQYQMIIEQRVSSEAPSMGAAYLLWFFLGILSIHRFYIGLTNSAILQLILNICVIGLIWTLIDVFLIPGLVARRRDQIRARVTQEVLATSVAR